jgi:DNA repair exonuclease SbcCD ATPase subunit
MGGIERYYPTHAADEQFSEPSPTHVDYPHHQHHHEQPRQQFHAGPARPPLSPEGSPDDLRSAYRHLQGRLAETEIALETVKTDRDSLYIELRHAQDSNLQRAPRAASADRGGAAPAGPTGPAGPSDEVSALRALLERREAEVAGLLEALAEERHARVALEEAADALARTEAAATGWPPAPTPAEPAGGAPGDAALRARLEECEAQLADAHASIAVLLDDAHAKEDAGHDAGRRPDARAAAGAAGAGAGGDGGAEVVRLRREVEALGKDRDALAAIVDQQEIALKLQGQQAAAAEAAFEELREAQTRVTRGSAHAADELTRLQGALADVLSRESHLLRVETVDAERFVGVLAEVRRRLLEADSLHEEVAQERATNARLVQYLLASADVAARSPPAGSGRVTEADRLRHENAHLRRDLATTASEASRASGEHRRAKDALQTELARLWRHAQDVARRLAAQEAAVAEARAARDDAVRAGAAVEKRLHEVRFAAGAFYPPHVRLTPRACAFSLSF